MGVSPEARVWGVWLGGFMASDVTAWLAGTYWTWMLDGKDSRPGGRVDAGGV